MITPKREIRSSDVAGHYDDLDPFYRELWGEHVHHGLWISGSESPQQAVVQLVATLAAELPMSAGDQICDVGCGYGGTARYLAEKHGARVTGLTISKVQFDYAVEETGERDNPRYLLENWETNSLASDSFDGVVSIECLGHIENKPAYFEQIHRVLKPGGRAVITAWLSSPNPAPGQCDRLLEPICREGRLPSMGSHVEYTELSEDAGLHLIEYRDLSSQVQQTWRITKRRLYWNLMTKPRYWNFVLRGKSSHSVFLLTVRRILRAYRTGAMQYGLFVFEKPV